MSCTVVDDCFLLAALSALTRIRAPVTPGYRNGYLACMELWLKTTDAEFPAGPSLRHHIIVQQEQSAFSSKGLTVNSCGTHGHTCLANQ
ncbi:hypothetical protein GQ44DRAFT_298284 [Phaeosphaeriaceae sp. PMI808]|nr:hypothetical protein GQ44DRAFT_298284 [Phaeosphaeriaceae sp. PMI808]